jgi:dimethylhistidine N-methyltransferase
MSGVSLDDRGPSTQEFLQDVLDGLSAPTKTLPCKYFYDRRGSLLFERICNSDEYYLTRSELEIMRSHAGEMADEFGERCVLVELGSGSSLKTRYLLDRMSHPAAYIPVDISAEHLEETATLLAGRYRHLPVLPVCVDFTQSFELPQVAGARRTMVYFPGSTIGNFGPGDAEELLGRIAKVCGVGGGLLIGVDLKKPRDLLERAYNDAKGATREFNLNLLYRINNELGADFDLSRFRHRAFYDEDQGRIEMHLVSLEAQSVTLQDCRFEFEVGESIHTENSYKYSPQGFRELSRLCGFQVERLWTDRLGLFSVQYLQVA